MKYRKIVIWLLVAGLFFSMNGTVAKASEIGEESEESLLEGAEEETESVVAQEEDESQEAVQEEAEEEIEADTEEGTEEAPVLTYKAHVQNIGWQDAVSDGETAGTVGNSLRIEAMQIQIEGVSAEELSVEYRAHVQNVGWQEYVESGETAGTTGEGYRLEALQIRLTGEKKEEYTLYYRVHVGNLGWLDWATQDEAAGSVGLGCRIEALEIMLVEADAEAPGSTEISCCYKAELAYEAHVQNYGWQGAVSNLATAGTIGKSLRVEALRMTVSGMEDLGISYRAHVQNVGWQDEVSDGELAGTTGSSLRMEAVEISLTGDAAQYYNVWYRAYVQNYGWLAWTSNGETAGSLSIGYRLEALQITVLPKGSSAPGETGVAYCDKVDVSYRAHVQNVGWQEYVSNGTTAGSTGSGLRMEALQITLSGMENLGLSYCAHVQNVGWQSAVSTDKIIGTVGSGLRMEALQISLTGEAAKYYDVWYCAYVENYGWLAWTKNGNSAGTKDLSLRMEALQIKILPKGSSAPGKTGTAFLDYTSLSKSEVYARQILNQVGWNLRAAFNWSAGLTYTSKVSTPASGVSHLAYYSEYGFVNRKGNCYVMASTFCQMARCLGYEAYLVEGVVPRAAAYGGGTTPHGWCEIVIGGTTYVFDPSYAQETGKNGYQIRYGTSGTWKYSNYSRVN